MGGRQRTSLFLDKSKQETTQKEVKQKKEEKKTK